MTGAPPVAAAPEALYVHVPFCVSHCPYCDFVVYAGAVARGPAARVDRFVTALVRELELRADALDARLPGRTQLRSVYLGGGTPSLLTSDQLDRILGTVRARFGIAPGAEVTLEANPSPDERGDLCAIARTGVNRISFGAQTMRADELKRIGRRHSPEDVGTAVRDARAAGIESLNLDLLYDLPDQPLEAWQRSLEAALSLAPDHLSLYALTLDDPDEEGITGPLGDHLPTSPGARRWRERARRAQDDERAADQYELAAERLRAAGWRGYEISNWARPGHESRHNLAYWRRRPYEAVGPGAHAFDGESRRWNAARLDRYVAALDPETAPPGLPPGAEERLTAAQARSEETVLGLRLAEGIPSAWTSDPAFSDAFAWASGAGLIERFDFEGTERVRLSGRGRLLGNELFAKLV